MAYCREGTQVHIDSSMSHIHPLDGDFVSAEFLRFLLRHSHKEVEIKFSTLETILFYCSLSIWYFYDERAVMVIRRTAMGVILQDVREYVRRKRYQDHSSWFYMMILVSVVMSSPLCDMG